VAEIRKTSLLPNIRDDAINALLGLTQGSLSYANYAQLFNDFYEGTDNLLRMTFVAFGLSIDWLIFSS
jgi:hypothetical protein